MGNYSYFGELVSTPAKRIKEAMDKKGYRQIDVCNKTGIKKPVISSYLSGKYQPKTDALLLLAECLGTNDAYLAGYDVSPEPLIWNPATQELWQATFSGIGAEQLEMLQRINQDPHKKELLEAYMQGLIDSLKK